MKKMTDDLQIGDVVEELDRRYLVTGRDHEEGRDVFLVEEIDPKGSPRSFIWAVVSAVITGLVVYFVT